MELQELNKYLGKLEGFGVIKQLKVTAHGEGGDLKVKFCGEIGTIDEGEIELTFKCVDILNLPLSGLIAPVELRLADNSSLMKIIESNYQDEAFSLYIIKDDVDVEWYVYAKSCEVKVLPVFYGK